MGITLCIPMLAPHFRVPEADLDGWRNKQQKALRVTAHVSGTDSSYTRYTLLMIFYYFGGTRNPKPCQSLQPLTYTCRPTGACHQSQVVTSSHSPSRQLNRRKLNANLQSDSNLCTTLTKVYYGMLGTLLIW